MEGQSFVEMLEEDVDLSVMEMYQDGFVILELGDPPKGSAQGILNYLERHDPTPEINSNEPTRQYRGTDRSNFSTVVNDYVDKRVNNVYALQTFSRVSRETGRDSEADVVVTNQTCESRPFMLGPVGFTKRKAVTVILPLDESLGPEGGFFSYCPQSIHWTQQELQERLNSGNIPMEEMRVALTQAILVLAELVVQFPAQKPNCHFVTKNYVPNIQHLNEDQKAFEREHVVPFTRNAVKRIVIDDWKKY